MLHLTNDELIPIGQVQSTLKEVKSAQNGCEQVIKVMGNAARKLPDRVHFLSLNQLIFQLTTIADIEERARELDGLAIGALQ